ncbi:MAG: hypothetical protein E6H54_10455 [Betaproteobacteria bacterium]|nr:MAG: hypothetical protein E6H54_10455 [Betaproteobacteria bacterium]
MAHAVARLDRGPSSTLSKTLPNLILRQHSQRERNIAHRLPAQVAALHESFTHCAGCDRVYWPGSHYARMCAALGRITQMQITDSAQHPSAAAKPGA